MIDPVRRTHHLARGRISLPGATYFVTWVTARRTPVLDSPTAIRALHTAFRSIQSSDDASVLVATVMPDHVHALLVLREALALGRIVAKMKHLGRTCDAGAVRWQQGFFDHRLRPTESLEDYVLYLLLNPYRAALVTCREPWPGWWCPQPARFALLAQAEPGPVPRPEWLDRQDLDERIVSGD